MGKPVIKTPGEISLMRDAGRSAMRVMRKAQAAIVPGLRTDELDRQVGLWIGQEDAVSAFLGYRGFPGQACISINEEVIHGIGGTRRIQFGDLVKLDIGVRKAGYIGDMAATVACGGGTPMVQKLMDVTIQALREGIAQVKAGNTTQDVGRAVHRVVTTAGFGVVREFCGHGVGRSVHEEPQVPNYVDRRESVCLRAGMTIAIEPMVTVGSPAVRILEDGWTVVTQDRQLSAHFEHTVLVTATGHEILTDDGFPPLY